MIKSFIGGKGREKMYLKDKKIILYRAEQGTDKEGFPIAAKCKPIHPGRLWAYVRQLSASEFYASQALQRSEEMLFVVNWRGDVAADCFIGYRDVMYNVTRVDTFEGYKEDLKVYAAKLLSQPKPEDIVAWQG